MKRRGLQLERWHRWMIYLIVLMLLFTGIVWARLQNLEQSGPPDSLLRTVKPWLLKIHGLSAMVFMVLIGTLLPVHVRHAWHAKKNRGIRTSTTKNTPVFHQTVHELLFLGAKTFLAQLLPNQFLQTGDGSDETSEVFVQQVQSCRAVGVVGAESARKQDNHCM